LLFIGFEQVTIEAETATMRVQHLRTPPYTYTATHTHTEGLSNTQDCRRKDVG